MSKFDQPAVTGGDVGDLVGDDPAALGESFEDMENTSDEDADGEAVTGDAEAK